jgi:hypothetical protein
MCTVQGKSPGDIDAAVGGCEMERIEPDEPTGSRGISDDRSSDEKVYVKRHVQAR